MKNFVLILTGMATISLSFFTSCCKGPSYGTSITVYYPNLSNTMELKAVRVDMYTIIDTVILGELTSSNNFSAKIDIWNDEMPNYILYIENTTYMDTISDITLDKKKCSGKINGIEYRFNGEAMTGNNITID